MGNPHRGEICVEIYGCEHTLRPSFQALAELENKLGIGLVVIARRFHDSTFGVQDVTAILWAGLRGANAKSAVTYDRVGEWVMHKGVVHFVTVATEFLAFALGGVHEPELD